MATSTNMISGLSSGFDWRSMIDQIIAVERQRVNLVTNKQTLYQKKLTEWQSFNTKLLALKTAAANLKDADAFAMFKASLSCSGSTLTASDMLAVTTSATASAGSCSLKITNLAAAQKVSSVSFSSATDALGDENAGDIVINGTVITIDPADTLANVVQKINNATSDTGTAGVTAGIVNYGAGDYRLILTSMDAGASGISLSNGGSSDILYRLGFCDTSRTAKNHISGGDRSDRFTDTDISIQSLLGLTDAQASGAGEIVINGQNIGEINLATDTLGDLQTKFATAGVTVSITTESEGNETYYRLMVAGSANTYTDKNNILETLGFIRGGLSDVAGVTGDVANTTAGAAITAETLIKDIDGYTGYQNTDNIHLTGTDTDGNTVSDDTLILSETTTIEDLLSKIESVFGAVTASITGAGKLQIVDNTKAPGNSLLSVTLGLKDDGGADDNTLRFDADGDLGSAGTVRKRELTPGADALLTVDGVPVTRSGNTIGDLIPGVTLDLLKADGDTTVSINIARDLDAIMAKINAFVASYNSVSSYIRTQSSYDQTTQQTGGLLFGDGTLASVKNELTSILVQTVPETSSDFSTLGLVGVSVDRDGQLATDSTKLRGYLTTNFTDLQKLFAGAAELYDTALYNITDSFDGYVSFKQQSLQGSIKGFTTQIEEMNARLERKREVMINQFIQMELALQKIQSQSNWLTSQAEAAINGWIQK